MSTELLELTGNESPEEIDALLDQLESEELSFADDESADVETTVIEEPKAEITEEAATSEEESSESSEEETPEGVLAKDGKNIIPFDVLEREREEKRLLQEQVDQLKSQEQEWQTKDRLFELRNKQLEELGVDPADLPENFKVTDDELNALAEDYPDIGKVIRHLVAKVNTLEPSAQAPKVEQPSSNPVADALAENTDLSAWQKEGGELWNKALAVDDQLRLDPKWQHKPLAERFAEVARLVKEPVPTEATKKPQPKEEELDSLPSSPSELGQTVTHSASPKDKLATADEAEIQSMFSGMSEAQVEALLSQIET